MNLMDSDGNSKDDVKVPETDLGREIEKAFEDGKDCLVTIIAAMGWFSFLFKIPFNIHSLKQFPRFTALPLICPRPENDIKLTRSL